jgi:hypothetical protein
VEIDLEEWQELEGRQDKAVRDRFRARAQFLDYATRDDCQVDEEALPSEDAKRRRNPPSWSINYESTPEAASCGEVSEPDTPSK